MPLTDPAQCADRAEDWYQFYVRNRGARVLQMVSVELIEEHRANPTQERGHHSVQLHEVLNFLRALPIMGKEFVYVAEPYSRYHIGYITERGEAATLDLDAGFATEKEAMHEVFLRRCNRLREMVQGAGR